MMKIYILFVLSSFFMACNSEKDKTEDTLKRPNIIFIVADDLNDIAVKGEGHPNASMPHLAKLAASGVNFVNAYTNAPICAPSRASFLLGIAPENSRYFGFKHETRYYKASPVLEEWIFR